MAKVSKQSVLQAAREVVAEKIKTLRDDLLSLKEGNDDNEKSSVGDKYETDRSMVQQEMEKLMGQIEIEELIYNQLRQIDPEKVRSKVSEGSLVETNKGIYLLGAACGKLTIDGTMVFGVSMESPLAKEMTGKAAGEGFTLNGNAFKIVAID